MIGRIVTGLIAVACAVWGTWLFVRIVREQGAQAEYAQQTMSPRMKAFLLLLVAASVTPVLLVFSWNHFRAGSVVAQARGQTWTYQLRAYRAMPFDTLFSDIRCEVGIQDRVFWTAPFPIPESGAYRESDCTVSTRDDGAVFRVGDGAYVFEKEGREIRWHPDSQESQ